MGPSGCAVAFTWPVIVALYTHLETLIGSPVTRLNRAVALAKIDGPETTLSILDELALDRRMLDYKALLGGA
ncbi:MAG: hypothetical protein MO846_11460 [Candidatus Devosia symbiotica]|nr:hypothetical protein [Candidatus Devosia symbiotica]